MNKGIKGIRAIIAISFLAVATAQAATNSWIFAGSSFWEEPSRWSAGSYPTIADIATYITNAASKTVTIDDFVTSTVSVTNSLTVSNLTVGATANTTNTLYLQNMRAGTFGALLPLRILNNLSISSQGVLQISNSLLRVNGLSGGLLQVDGTLRVLRRADIQVQDATISSGAVLQFALGTNSSPVVVSNDLTVAGTVNVIDGGGFTTNIYTLFTYVGALTDNGLTVGTLPPGNTAVLDTGTLGQVNLVVNGGTPPPPIAPLQITSIVRNANDIVIAWSTSGAGTTNRVQVTSGTVNGSYDTNFVDLSANILISGATTNYPDVGGATNTPSRFYRVRLVP